MVEDNWQDAVNQISLEMPLEQQETWSQDNTPQKQLEFLKRQVLDLWQQKRDVEMRCERLQSEKADVEMRCERLQSEKADVEMENERLEADFEEKCKEIADLHSQLDKSRQQLAKIVGKKKKKSKAAHGIKMTGLFQNLTDAQLRAKCKAKG